MQNSERQTWSETLRIRKNTDTDAERKLHRKIRGGKEAKMSG